MLSPDLESDQAEALPPLSDEELEELTALALAADPGEPLADDAVPIAQHLAAFAGSLPSWYMPPVMAGSGQRWRLPVVLAIVSAFLLIEGLGLCNTFGQLTWA